LVGSIFHMTRKIVSEMTYNVSMGTLNPTIPYNDLLCVKWEVKSLHSHSLNKLFLFSTLFLVLHCISVIVRDTVFIY